MTSRPSTAAPILAAVAIGLATLAGYVGGYFWLGDFNTNPSKTLILRGYRTA